MQLNLQGELWDRNKDEWGRMDCPLLQDFRYELSLTSDGRLYNVFKKRYYLDELGPFKNILKLPRANIVYLMLDMDKNLYEVIPTDNNFESLDYKLWKEEVDLLIPCGYSYAFIRQWKIHYKSLGRDWSQQCPFSLDRIIEIKRGLIRTKTHAYYLNREGLHPIELPNQVLAILCNMNGDLDNPYPLDVIIIYQENNSIKVSSGYPSSTRDNLKTEAIEQLIAERFGVMGTTLISNKDTLILGDGSQIRIDKDLNVKYLNIPQKVFKRVNVKNSRTRV